MSGILQAYRDLGEVFSKWWALSIPPQRPYNCAIDLLPVTTLSSSQLYQLSRREHEAMDDNDHGSLA